MVLNLKLSIYMLKIDKLGKLLDIRYCFRIGDLVGVCLGL